MTRRTRYEPRAPLPILPLDASLPEKWRVVRAQARELGEPPQWKALIVGVWLVVVAVLLIVAWSAAS